MSREIKVFLKETTRGSRSSCNELLPSGSWLLQEEGKLWLEPQQKALLFGLNCLTQNGRLKRETNDSERTKVLSLVSNDATNSYRFLVEGLEAMHGEVGVRLYCSWPTTMSVVKS